MHAENSPQTDGKPLRGSAGPCADRREFVTAPRPAIVEESSFRSAADALRLLAALLESQVRRAPLVRVLGGAHAG